MSTIGLIILGLLPLILSFILDLLSIVGFWFFGQHPSLVVYPTDHLLALIIPIAIYYIYNVYNDRESNKDLLKNQFVSLPNTLKVFIITFPFLMLSLLLFKTRMLRFVGISMGKHKIIFLLIFILFGPIAEEILFRGIILKSLFKLTAIENAIIVACVFNTLFHVISSYHLIYLLYIIHRRNNFFYIIFKR